MQYIGVCVLQAGAVGRTATATFTARASHALGYVIPMHDSISPCEVATGTPVSHTH